MSITTARKAIKLNAGKNARTIEQKDKRIKKKQTKISYGKELAECGIVELTKRSWCGGGGGGGVVCCYWFSVCSERMKGEKENVLCGNERTHEQIVLYVYSFRK